MKILKDKKYSRIRGFNYQPGYGANGYEIWYYFKPDIIEKEIYLGKKYFPGINTIRIWLSWDAYLRERKRFKYNFETFLSILEKYSLRAIPVLFNGWYGFPYFGGIGLRHINGWKYLPGYYRKYFTSYLDDIAGSYINDERILVWDLCNEPSGLYFMDGKGQEKQIVLEFLTFVYRYCKKLGVRHPLSIGCAPSIEEIKSMELISDVINFHPYWMKNIWGGKKDKKEFIYFLDECVKFANKKNKPLLATETGWGSLADEERVETLEFELSELKKRKIGFLCHLLHHTLVADGHKPDYGPISCAGYMAFIDEDYSLRYGHEIFNRFCERNDEIKGKINFFEEYVKIVIEKCKVIRDIDGELFVLRVPSGDMKYPAFWVRDAFYIYESGLVEEGEIKNCLKLIASRQNREKERKLENGLIVPPFSIPDHINFDGKPVFFPGTYSSGENQGDGSFGFYPPHDNQYFFIDISYLYFKKTDDINLFKEEIDGITLIKRLEFAFEGYNIDKKTELPFSDLERHTVDWGFCDTVKKSGLLLFPSLLRYKSALSLKEIEEKIGDIKKSEGYQGKAERIKKNIIENFYDEKSGWFFSSTGCGKQFDVLGTLFAIYSGILDKEKEERTLKVIFDGYKNNTCIDENGYVRHIPTYNDFDENTMWEKSLCEKGTYQNGGYWAFFTGFYIYALSKIDKNESRNLLENFINHILKERNKGAPYEWENLKTGKFSGCFYGASASLLWKIIKEGECT